MARRSRLVSIDWRRINAIRYVMQSKFYPGQFCNSRSYTAKAARANEHYEHGVDSCKPRLELGNDTALVSFPRFERRNANQEWRQRLYLFATPNSDFAKPITRTIVNTQLRHALCPFKRTHRRAEKAGTAAPKRPDNQDV